MNPKNTFVLGTAYKFTYRKCAAYFHVLYTSGEDYKHTIAKKFDWRHVLNNTDRLLHLYMGDGDENECYEVIVVESNANSVLVHYAITAGRDDDITIGANEIVAYNSIETEQLSPEGQVLCDIV